MGVVAAGQGPAFATARIACVGWHSFGKRDRARREAPGFLYRDVVGQDIAGFDRSSGIVRTVDLSQGLGGRHDGHVLRGACAQLVRGLCGIAS